MKHSRNLHSIHSVLQRKVGDRCEYSVFSMCLCNLNARFTPIFQKITLIPHLLMFRRIKR